MGAVVSGVGSLVTGKAPGLNNTQQQASYVSSPVGQGDADAARAATLQALSQQQALADQLAAQGGLGTQSDVLKQQQALANQLQAQTLGQGPNPAQEQFKQNLGASTQQAAGTIASQKGISPALMAELVARQQGAAGQNAASNAATLQAQQQLAAQQGLAQQQAQMQGVAGSQIGQQANAVSNLLSGRQNQEKTMYDAITNTNQANMAGQNAALNANAATNQANATSQGNFTSGIMNAAGGVLGKGASSGMFGSGVQGFFAAGGEVPKEDLHLHHISMMYHEKPLIQPKTEQIPQKKAEGGFASYQEGALVPGKPKVDHNSFSNDTVKAMLSPGEVVIPLDVMNSKDPVKGSAKFVQAILEKKGKEDTSDKNKEEFHSALKEAISKRTKGKK